MRSLFIKLTGDKAYDFIRKHADPESPDTLTVHTTNVFNVLIHPRKYKSIINLGKVNDIRYINKFFENVNERLDIGDTFIVRVETFSARRDRKKINRIPVIGHLYSSMEFIFLRIFPKVPVLKKFYFFITRGHNRLLSKAETMGRLVSCGFEIVEFKSMRGLLYIVTKKVKEPSYDMNPSYGLLFRMSRVSKDGKMIKVYKLRTMHPYAEYLQDYVLRMNGYSDSGKPAGDFRLTMWGKFLRRYWLDELPQLINVMKGELKLVGVRPVSKRYMQDIPADLRELRLRQKPGCIPPYVALNASGNVSAVLEAEKHYLMEKLRDPYFTDIRFFGKAVYNIIVRRKRSA